MMLTRTPVAAAAAALFVAGGACGQTTDNPFPQHINAEEGVVVVGVEEFATVPDSDGRPARMMLLVDEPGTERMFVNDMRGPLHNVSHDGDVRPFVDIDDPEWGVGVESSGRERGFQSFAFHPEFGEEGAEGYGKFYTWTDSHHTEPAADFDTGEDGTHHTVLHEWTAQDPTAETYDGEPPRELMRQEQPFGNHNAGHLAFHPLAEPGDPEYGLLYIGSADGGSGGDPLDLSQDPGSAFGKILRIDPLGSNGPNGEYGIPEDNPFVDEPDTLDEIYALGMRNPQRFGWDPANGNLFVADIGQSIVELVSLVPTGGNLGWADWEGSWRYLNRSEVSLEDPRGDPDVIFPVVEYGHHEPLLMDPTRRAVTGIHVHRSGTVPQLQDLVLFGDFPNGEIFYFPADDLPEGGNQAIRRVLLDDGEGEKTFHRLVREKNEAQGLEPAGRADLRFADGPDGEIFLLNKHDRTIRRLVP